jgi:monoamine oxidase
MRISHHHQTTLSYCRELQVATEVFVPDCESAFLAQTRGPLAGRRVRLREARADFDGYIAELLSKALPQAQLDQPLTAEDRDRVLAYLRGLGALDERRQYRGSSRRGVDAGSVLTAKAGDVYSEPIGKFHRGHNPHPDLPYLCIAFCLTSPDRPHVTNRET